MTCLLASCLCQTDADVYELQGNHDVVQLASSVCPGPSVPATDQRVLAPPAVNGSASLNIPTPGTVRRVPLGPLCSDFSRLFLSIH